MSVITTNLIMGPANMYLGLFSSVVEPADTAVNTTPQLSAGWNDVGGTNGGVKLTVNLGYTALDVDQIVDVPERRLSSRDVTVDTSLAEVTLDNLKMLLNDATVTTGSGYKALEPINTNSATQPVYRAVILDGYAPSGFRRRVIVRKTLQTADVATSFEKTNQTLWSMTLNAHYVSSTIAPFHITDATS